MSNARRRWTKEEEEIIQELAGTCSFNHIGKLIDRTPKAVEKKMKSMGITSLMAEGGWLSATRLAGALGIYNQEVISWKKDYNLPLINGRLRYRKKSTDKTNSYRILPEDFWKWAEEHKHLINFREINEEEIGMAPYWVEDEKEKAKRTIPAKVRRRLWTPEEDKQLLRLYYQEAKNFEQIGKIMKRSTRSISNRMARLRKQKEAAS